MSANVGPERVSGFSQDHALRRLGRLCVQLERPAFLPEDAVQPRAFRHICAGVYDGVFAFTDAEGKWHTGAAAFDELVEECVFEDLNLEVPSGRALTNAVEQLRDPAMLDQRAADATKRTLYLHGRRPYSTRWIRLVGGESDVDLYSFYGINMGKEARTLASGFRRSVGATPGWWNWTSKRPVQPRRFNLTFKLYIHVEPQSMPLALRRIIPILVDHQVIGFKVANNIRAALRPDKLVVYLRSFEKAMAAARTLQVVCEGIPPHSLPFGVPYGHSDLISWGVDPPFGIPAFSLSGGNLSGMRGSWRGWLCRVLAGGIVRAHLAGRAGDACQLACRRLTLEGIRLNTWFPGHLLLEEWRGQLRKGNSGVAR